MCLKVVLVTSTRLDTTERSQMVTTPKVTMVDALALNAAPYNPRKISTAQMQALKNSLRTHGFIENIVVQRSGMIIIGGHQRLTAYLEICKEDSIKPTKVPCVVLDVSDRTAKKLNIALNKVTGEFDSKKLGQLLIDLDSDSTLIVDEILSMGMSIDEKNRYVEIAAPSVDVPTDDNIKEFGRSITLSVEFETVESRDKAKQMLATRAKAENKKTGAMLIDLLQKRLNHNDPTIAIHSKNA